MNDTNSRAYSEQERIDMLRQDLKFYIDFYGSNHPMTQSVKNALCEATGLRIIK